MRMKYNKEINDLNIKITVYKGEIETLVDEIAKDETKRTEYTNSMSVLMRMYETKGNPHKDEILQKINEYAKTKTTKAEVVEALNEANETIAA